jgi:hypothetical protein
MIDQWGIIKQENYYMYDKREIPDIPQSGWECIDIEDLGAPVMACQMCNEIIRYAHYMQHKNYPDVLVVGCICAGNMEGDPEKARERDSFMRSRIGKRKHWLERKWKISQRGNLHIKSDGFIVIMKKKKDLWLAFVKNEDNNYQKMVYKKSANENEMKLAAFDCLTNILVEKKIGYQHYIKTPIKTEQIEPKEIKSPEPEIITEKGFIDILKQLVKEQGKTALTDTRKCKALLADYTKNEYKKESRRLLLAVEAGVAKAVDGAVDLPACLKAKIRELEEEFDLTHTAAADTVETLALVLRGNKTHTVLQGDLF